MNQPQSYWKKAFLFPKKIIDTITLKIQSQSPPKEPQITWEEKVLKRKLKTQEAKKAWEEKNKASKNEPIGSIAFDENDDLEPNDTE